MTLNEIIAWLEGMKHEPVYPGTNHEVSVAKSAKVLFAHEVAEKLRAATQNINLEEEEGDTSIIVRN